MHLSTLSHTLCVSRWGKARILRKGRFYRRRQKKKQNSKISVKFTVQRKSSLKTET